jgi:ribosomal protein S15P/S13E
MLKKTKTTWGHIGDEYKYNLSFKEKDELTEKDFYDLDVTIQENDLRDHLQSHEHDFESSTPLSKSILQHSLSTLKVFYKEWTTHYKALREIVEIGMKSGKLSEHVMKYIDGKPECRSIAMKRMMQIMSYTIFNKPL